MKYYIRQTTSNLYDSDEQIISSNTSKIYVLYPAEGKQLKNIKTGEIFLNFICLRSKELINEYVEIEPKQKI